MGTGRLCVPGGLTPGSGVWGPAAPPGLTEGSAVRASRRGHRASSRLCGLVTSQHGWNNGPAHHAKNDSNYKSKTLSLGVERVLGYFASCLLGVGCERIPLVEMRVLELGGLRCICRVYTQVGLSHRAAGLPWVWSDLRNGLTPQACLSSPGLTRVWPESFLCLFCAFGEALNASRANRVSLRSPSLSLTDIPGLDGSFWKGTVLLASLASSPSMPGASPSPG